MTPTALSQLSPRSKWIIAGCILLALIAFGSVFYGLTQRSIKKEKFMQDQFNQQITIEKERSDKLDKQNAEQTRTMQAMQTRMDQLVTSTYNANKSRDEVTIRTVYLPGTDKVTERTETKIIERDNSTSGTKTETHAASAATSTVETAATTTVTIASTEKEHATETTSATSTVSIKTESKPASSTGKKEMRLTIGAAYHDNKFKPAAGYTVRAFGIGSLVSVGPGILVGDDLLGAAANADIMQLPRIGVGYGCNFNMKNCGILYNIGVRLDF